MVGVLRQGQRAEGRCWELAQNLAEALGFGGEAGVLFAFPLPLTNPSYRVGRGARQAETHRAGT